MTNECGATLATERVASSTCSDVVCAASSAASLLQYLRACINTNLWLLAITTARQTDVSKTTQSTMYTFTHQGLLLLRRLRCFAVVAAAVVVLLLLLLFAAPVCCTVIRLDTDSQPP
jgi:hypothetical protein